MQKSGRIELGLLIMGMAELYNKSLSETAITIYITALENYPIEKIKSAINHIISQRVYTSFPMPAEFIEHIDPSANLEVRALLAVEKVLDMNEIQGGTMSVSFDDPIIHHVIMRYGGWPTVANKIREICVDKYSQKQMPFWRKEFASMYSFFAKQTDLAPPPKRLIGQMETDNIALGHYDPDSGILKLPSGTVQLDSDNTKLIGG